jgi:histidinol phosphatase-like PHP family hydrolase
MDMNTRIAALLRDFAAVQPSKQRMWGYKRAASAVLALEQPIETLLNPDGTLQRIPNIGPASTRIILEVLSTGGSPTIEGAIAASGQQQDVERRRGLRDHFLSRAQVVAALRNQKLTGPRVEDYHGDLQMHSTWSDGSQTLAEIVETGVNLGYAFCAVTDHSYGLKIAGGVSMAELVVAAPLSVLRSPEDQTARMVAAASAPGVHILGHPRGRMFGSRPGVTADWNRVFAAAQRSNVAIEIDGDPARQDVDYDLARRAVDAGCLFALDSDAHSSGELPRYAQTAIAHARLAGVPAERVINCWPLDRLLKWARRGA